MTCTNTFKIVTWNVDGIRSRIFDKYNDIEFKKTKLNKRKVIKNSPLDYLISLDPDIICIQETKCQDKHINKFKFPGKYKYVYHNCHYKSYAGVMIISKIKPLPDQDKYQIKNCPNLELYKGRILIIRYEKFILINTYVPNSGSNLDFRLNQFDKCMYNHLHKLKENNVPIIWTGDLNVSRFKTDVPPYVKMVTAKEYIKNPNKGRPGYIKEEIDNINKILKSGFVDIFKYLYPNKISTESYTQWSRLNKQHRYNTKNGMRLDYFIIQDKFINIVKDIKIYKYIGYFENPINYDVNDIYNNKKLSKIASDHCPLLLSIDFSKNTEKKNLETIKKKDCNQIILNKNMIDCFKKLYDLETSPHKKNVYINIYNELVHFTDEIKDDIDVYNFIKKNKLIKNDNNIKKSSTYKKLLEVLQTGTIKKISELYQKKSKEACLKKENKYFDFCSIDGIGVTTKSKIVEAGYKCIYKLQDDIKNQKIKKQLKLTKSIISKIINYDPDIYTNVKIPRSKVKIISSKLISLINKNSDLKKYLNIKVGGSYARGKDYSSDIDFIVYSKNDILEGKYIIDNIIKNFEIEFRKDIYVLSKGVKKSLLRINLRNYKNYNFDNNVRIDIFFSKYKSVPFAYISKIGSGDFQKRIRRVASNLCYKLNEHGIIHKISNKELDCLKNKNIIDTINSLFTLLKLDIYKIPIKNNSELSSYIFKQWN